MKIAYLLCSNIFGGLEKIVCESVNALCAENEILLIVPKGCEYKDKISHEVEIYEYKNFDTRWNLLLYFELYRVLKNFGAEILHSHGAKATQMAVLLNKFLSFKLVAMKHNSRKGAIFNRVQNVIAVSQNVAKTINHECKVLYFGIKSEKITPQTPSKNLFIITAIGRLDRIKGFDELIKSCAKLPFDFALQIVGKGAELGSLQGLAQSLGISEKVKFIGFSDEIPSILASSHLQVISSRSEGMPLVLSEGLSYSPVVISTNVGGIGEILDAEFFVDYDNLSDKICEIYENYDEKVAEFSKKHAKAKQILSFDFFISSLKKYYKEMK